MAISRFHTRCRAIAVFVMGALGCGGAAQVAQAATERPVWRHAAQAGWSMARPQTAPVRRMAPGTFVGGAFDTCAAPSVAAIASWWGSSEYHAAGIYLGGINRACPDGNLSADWVHKVSAQGWRLIPAYVGRQAPCVTAPSLSLMDPANAPAQGVSAADDAVARASALGIAPGSAIYFDLENYRHGNKGCTNTVLRYVDSWVRRLHSHGYLAGVYSSAGSGIADLAAAVGTSGLELPDALWIARWDENQTTADVVLPAGVWAQHQRIKQFAGGHKETHGPATIDVDGDYVDGPVAVVR